ncbi:hypothetical protein, partial [Cupriavidus sp. UME77]|uniref:hypothetical protein n=1 Tax=Cupriavidus sp. UME77 TaxID=1862321 RepID=UPI001C7F990E
VGGGGAEGSAAAATAGMADRFNRQLHPDEKTAIKTRANGDEAEEKRLTKAACYVVQCWAQFPVGSEEYNKSYVNVMEAGALENEIQWVSLQKQAGLFNYTATQKLVDSLWSDPKGAAIETGKIVTGGLALLSGTALCSSTAAGCVPGSLMMAFGSSDATEGMTGIMNRLSGDRSAGYNPVRSIFNQAYPTFGNTIYDGLNLATSLMALNAQVPLKIGVADGLNRPKSMFGVTVSTFDNLKLMPITNMPIASGSNQALSLYGVVSKSNTFVNDIRSTGGEK